MPDPRHWPPAQAGVASGTVPAEPAPPCADGAGPAGRSGDTHVPPPHSGRRPAVLLVTLLVVLAAVSWRRGGYFTGSLDPVVAGKAAVSLLALVLAFLLAQSGPRRRLGTGSLWWVGAVLGSSAFGAWTAGNLAAGGVVAVRVLVLSCTVFFLLRAAPAVQVLGGLASACATIGGAAALTGLAGLATGRLSGGIPEMDPNELALLAGIALVFLAWRTVLGAASWLAGVGAVFFFAVVWATGSRTALLALVLGILVMALHVRRPRVGLVVGGLVVGALGTIWAVATGVLAGFVERDGTGGETLDSRLIAWRAAVGWAESGWQEVFGGGLSVKVIRVQGQAWDTQPLDSSWVSLLVQAGVLGLVVAAGWVLWTTRGALRAPYPYRVLFLGLSMFLLGRSLMESGLLDASPAFLLYLAVSLLAEGGSRPRLRSEAALVSVHRR